MKLWNRLTGACIKTIAVDDNFSVMSVSIDKDYLACSFNQTIIVWRLDKSETRKSLVVRKLQEYKEHFKRIESIKLRMEDDSCDGFIVSGSQDGFIKYWNIRKAKSIHTFNIHNKKRINSVYFDETRIASAAVDHNIKILDFNVAQKISAIKN